jgi:two-component system, NtrC family, response regulator AtoC
MRRHILVVDDDAAIRELVGEFLADDETTVAEAEDGAAAQAAVESAAPDLVLLDMRLPDQDGLDVLGRLHAVGIPVVVITADSSSSRTIRAIQAGAYDYLVKPLEPETVRHVVDRALEHQRLAEEVRELSGALAGREVRERIVGAGAAMQQVYKLIGRVAGSDAAVLITGETGTGKELAADTIHQNSRRRRGPLVKVNCAALPETLLESELFGHEKGAFTGAVDRRKGRFELADSGTIFLDEVGELSPSTQKKLLRVVQFGQFERVGGSVTLQVDVRVLAATNRELEREVQAGRFREDLYYRLNVICVNLPPLRERREDIPALVAHFLDLYRPAPGAPPMRISQAAMDMIMTRDWPGNVRQLENTIQRAVVLAGGPVITPEDLEMAPGPGQAMAGVDVVALVRSGAGLAQVLADLERALLAEALRQAEGDPDEAGRRLGLLPGAMRDKLAAYNLDRPH